MTLLPEELCDKSCCQRVCFIVNIVTANGLLKKKTAIMGNTKAEDKLKYRLHWQVISNLDAH